MYTYLVVVRNVFNDKAGVEEYRMVDVAREMTFDWESLICLALLLGSDYTDGIHGIGIGKGLRSVLVLFVISQPASHL